MSMPVVFLLVLISLAGCTQFPGIDEMSATRSGPAPTLVPIDTLLAAADAPTPARATDLAERAARLKARAALMRGPVLDPATRARLAAAMPTG